jgi:GMP synthase-like glutamine amidotransferase
MLAVAAGGEVARGAAGPEHGLDTVTVNEPDVLLDGGPLTVVQWHDDTVTRLPEDAQLLASSDRYPVQAFRIGEVAWGMQFHIEATPEMVGEWAANDGVDASVVEAVRFAEDELREVGNGIAERFARIVTG